MQDFFFFAMHKCMEFSVMLQLQKRLFTFVLFVYANEVI